MTEELTGVDYQLRWPHALFVGELRYLLGCQADSNWQGKCELLLEEAFQGAAPRDAFRGRDDGYPFGADASSRITRTRFLEGLLARAPLLRAAVAKTPYYSQRRSAAGGAPRITKEQFIRQFIRLIRDLEANGYLEQAFDKDCVDAPADVDPSELLEEALGVPDLWPLDVARIVESPTLALDLTEVFHDLVARPRDRSMHPYGGCGWHHSEFALQPGRQLYRWRVNALLERTDLALRLSDEGDDEGRLVTRVDASRTRLATTMANRTDPETGDAVRHALALFQARGATPVQKRSAIVALAGVLEARRPLLKQELLSKDEGALFLIANEFALRHSNSKQRGQYDPAFLDWIFWLYLSTVDLTDRLIQCQEEGN